MNYLQAFEILEIQPTDDRKAIKIAYAQLVKQYHPEEHPDEWQRIHDAYECAMSYAGRRQDVIAMPEMDTNVRCEPVKVEITKREPIEIEFDEREPEKKAQPYRWEMPADPESVLRAEVDEPEKDEAEFDFRDIDNLVQQEHDKRKAEADEVLVSALDKISELGEGKKQKAAQWEHVLGLPEVQMARTNAAFLYCLGDFLGKSKVGIDCYKIIRRFLDEVRKEMTDSLFNDGGMKANLEAWEVASEGLEQAVWWKYLISVQKVVASPKFRYIGGVIMMILVIVLRFNTALVKIGNNIDRLEQNNQLVLQLEQRDDSGSLYFAKDSKIPSKYRNNGWGMWNGVPSKEYREYLGIDSHSEIAVCFLIGYEGEEVGDAIVVLPLEEFGLENSAYDIWQYSEGEYHNVTLNEPETGVFPYEEDGALYLKVGIYKTEGDKIDVESYRPLMIMTKGNLETNELSTGL